MTRSGPNLKPTNGDNRKLDDAGPDCALLGARWYDRSGGHLGKTGSLHTQIASANALSVGIAKAASVRRAVAARARDTHPVGLSHEG